MQDFAKTAAGKQQQPDCGGGMGISTAARF
jgi:hypothetical protein